MNSIICGDTLYSISTAYRQGALAMRAGRHYLCNPFRGGTRSHDDWSNGHTHEAAGEHLRFGLDLIKDKPAGSRVFEIDPDVPRDLDGNVDMEWYSLALLGMELSRS